MEEGLAEQMAMEGAGMPAPSDPGMGGGQGEMAMLDQVVQLIMEGVEPEELIQNGVPQAIVEQAMAIVLSQTQGGGGAPQDPMMAQDPMTDAGLAATAY